MGTPPAHERKLRHIMAHYGLRDPLLPGSHKNQRNFSLQWLVRGKLSAGREVKSSGTLRVSCKHGGLIFNSNHWSADGQHVSCLAGLTLARYQRQGRCRAGTFYKNDKTSFSRTLSPRFLSASPRVLTLLSRLTMLYSCGRRALELAVWGLSSIVFVQSVITPFMPQACHRFSTERTPCSLIPLVFLFWLEPCWPSIPNPRYRSDYFSTSFSTLYSYCMPVQCGNIHIVWGRGTATGSVLLFTYIAISAYYLTGPTLWDRITSRFILRQWTEHCLMIVVLLPGNSRIYQVPIIIPVGDVLIYVSLHQPTTFAHDMK